MDPIRVTLTDTSGPGATVGLDANPDADGMIIVDLAGYDVAGIDLAAGTVGVWVGREPDNREWAVVDRFTPEDLAAAQPAQSVATPAPRSAAEAAFSALTAAQRAVLLRRVFEAMEFGDWDADGWQRLGGVFADAGITFTND